MSTDVPDGAARPSRAGRNLPAALAVGLLLGAGVVTALLTYRQSFIGIVALACALSTVELAGALRRGAGVRLALPPVLLGGQAMIWLSWPFELSGVLVAFAITTLGCLAWRVRLGVSGYLRDVTASVFTSAYVSMFAAFAAMLVLPADGGFRGLCFLIGVVASDTGGYASGVFFGRHPMAPRVSPNKSWEGFAGSLLAGLVAGVLSVPLLLGGPWWVGAFFGVAIVCSSTLGDLMESLIKRDLAIKDMGTLLPGHGGLMDRMDSLLPSAVVAWSTLFWFLPA
ncbi:phosphatidate cytidylyltransferase [Actinopolyspora mortivallis]|uniref:Phosphatidate cytidylyltransferase n=1 Tax=Actinopolyspora mortivallis TaxID=33906 RepID=A0A2T0GTX5_ACTMO|nr:phosphatidate cytidylyltransferase [Actinopolyspora mortivallis]PRW62552.1 phosphatidate cytidylyltransferase [Actinopolyspora mortivallis]